jgi:chlorophyllide a reductase subunit X
MTEGFGGNATDRIHDLLREEAEIEPDQPHTGPVKKDTQIIAIYGKGGIGKSFTLANLSCMLAQLGKKVLLIGCDPKSDTTSLLFGGRACPTIIETSSKMKAAGAEITISDVCFKRDGVFAMELGGPEVGRGCGGRGIIHGFETLEKLGFHDWDFDYVLLDFLGDVVCGGFGLPIARDMCQKVVVVGSNDLQSLYVANNVCSAVQYFRKLGGNVGVAGMVINKDDGSGEAAAFAEAVGIPVLAAIPQDDDIRKKSANYQIIGHPDNRWGPLFQTLAENLGLAPPVLPEPLDQDGLIGLFDSSDTGGDYVLVPRSPKTCARPPPWRVRPSKSSTTRCDDGKFLPRSRRYRSRNGRGNAGGRHVLCIGRGKDEGPGHGFGQVRTDGPARSGLSQGAA